MRVDKTFKSTSFNWQGIVNWKKEHENLKFYLIILCCKNVNIPEQNYTKNAN